MKYARQLISASACLAFTAEAGLVAHYTFDGDTDDWSGNGHHASIVGGSGGIVTDVERGQVFDPAGASYLDLEATAGAAAFSGEFVHHVECLDEANG